MKERTIYVEISGGCYRGATNVPGGWAVDLIDWDNLLGDGADTAEEWTRLSVKARKFITENCPDDYERVLERLAASAAPRTAQ